MNEQAVKTLLVDKESLDGLKSISKEVLAAGRNMTGLLEEHVISKGGRGNKVAANAVDTWSLWAIALKSALEKWELE